MSDEIIQEVWQIKDAIAQECGFDLERLVARLRQNEKTSSAPAVDLSSVEKQEHHSA